MIQNAEERYQIQQRAVLRKQNAAKTFWKKK